MQGAIDALIDEQYMRALLAVLSMDQLMSAIERHAAGAGEVLRGVRRYAALVGSLADARNSEDVTRVLEESAAPVGSWREYRRRTAGFIAGHLGVGGGGELVFAENRGGGGYVSPVLQVGFEVGTPIGRSGCTFNLMVPVIDLGTLATARIGQDLKPSGSSGADGQAVSGGVDFSAVFAPGLFVGFGLGNSPFVLMAGAQVSPAARQYFACAAGMTCATTESEPAVRIMGYLGIDLPAFPIF
jgi:hypothetical protein